MRKIFKNNKGQSLVEVTVALSLLMVVLVGVVTLALNAVTLMLSSRMRTEATALAQQGLELVKNSKETTCGDLVADDYVVTETNGVYEIANYVSDPDNSKKTVGGTDYFRKINISAQDMIKDDENQPVSDYATAKVTVSWSAKGKSQTMEVSQIIKK